MGLFDRFKKRCPRCQGTGLKKRQFLRATKVDAQGRRYPDFIVLAKCRECGALLKWGNRQEPSEISEEEWSQFVEPEVPPARSVE